MKQNFPRFQARTSNEMKQIIDGFLQEKNMTQAEFVEKYFPGLLMSIDEKLYFDLYKKAYGNEKLREISMR